MVWAPVAVFAAFVIYAAIRDVASYSIPNWVSGGLVLAFFITTAFVLTPGQIGQHALVGLAALVAGMLIFSLGWVGGGDAKLMAAISLWLGLAGAGSFLLWTALAGGVLSLLIITARTIASGKEISQPWLGRLLAKRGGVPYGVALSAGGLVAMAMSGPFDISFSALSRELTSF